MTTDKDRGALSRVATYVRIRHEKPLRTLDGSIHRVHAGTEWDAELHLNDLKRVVGAILAPPSTEEIAAVALALAQADADAIGADGVRSGPDRHHGWESEARKAIAAFMRVRMERAEATS